jgi:hypothetical protein
MKNLSSVRGGLVVLAAFALGLSACGSTPAAEPATPNATAQSVEIPEAWDMTKMSLEQQVEYMKQKVVPALGPVFQAASAEHYADFGCKTCHGPENKPPKEFLPHLTFKDGTLTEFQTAAEVSKFMAEKVVPAMATAFGAKPYNPETHEGFGCNGCHAIDGAP